MSARCYVDWAAFGLEPPDAHVCQLTGAYLAWQGCVHEHITEARPCSHHLAIMHSYGPFSEWGCARCLPEQVRAPLLVTPLAKAVSLLAAELEKRITV